MVSANVEMLRPDVRDAAKQLVGFLNWFGYPARITSAVRSRALQSRLYTTYLAGGSKYPAAKPGTSKHERGLAFDLGTSAEGLEVADYLATQYLGLRSGKSFGDPIHFEARA